MGIEPDWPAPSNVTALTTLRGADFDAVFREQFVQSHCCKIQQVHGAAAVDVTQMESGAEADACYSRDASIACRVVTADCLPLLVCNRQGTEVAAVHAGWRGLAAGVIENTFARLQTPPDELLVWLGPVISQQHFEVGKEVRDAFVNTAPTRLVSRVSGAFEPHGSKFMADLPGLARARLEHLGCRAIFGGERCTFSDAGSFYSWRRDRSLGRLHSVIAFS